MKLLLFDLDNTLYPTFEQVNVCRLMAVRAMIKRGLKGDEPSLMIKLNNIIKRLGSNNQGHYDALVKEVNGNYDLSIISIGITTYNTTKQRLMKLYPNTKRVLNVLKKRFMIGILTKGNPKKQWDKINRLGLYEFFKNNVWIVNDNESKELVINGLLNKFNLKPSEVMLIGDRVDSDISAAVNAGIISVRLMRGPYKQVKGVKSDFVINSLSDLLELSILKQTS